MDYRTDADPFKPLQDEINALKVENEALRQWERAMVRLAANLGVQADPDPDATAAAVLEAVERRVRRAVLDALNNERMECSRICHEIADRTRGVSMDPWRVATDCAKAINGRRL